MRAAGTASGFSTIAGIVVWGLQPVAKSEGPRAPTLTCLRSVLMKPEHEAWMDEIWERLGAACDEVVSG